MWGTLKEEGGGGHKIKNLSSFHPPSKPNLEEIIFNLLSSSSEKNSLKNDNFFFNIYFLRGVYVDLMVTDLSEGALRVLKRVRE